MISFGKYSKSITALVGAAIAWATLVLQSAPVDVTGDEWLQAAILFATAVGVYGVTNSDS